MVVSLVAVVNTPFVVLSAVLELRAFKAFGIAKAVILPVVLASRCGTFQELWLEKFHMGKLLQF